MTRDFADTVRAQLTANRLTVMSLIAALQPRQAQAAASLLRKAHQNELDQSDVDNETDEFMEVRDSLITAYLSVLDAVSSRGE